MPGGGRLTLIGVLMLLALEIGQTTPPFGMLLFVMRGVAPPETTMRQIYAAVTPFVLLEIGILAFLIAVTWLPALLAGCSSARERALFDLSG